MIIKVSIDNQTYEVEVGNLSDCPVIATVAGETFEVWPAETSTSPARLSLPAEPPEPHKPSQPKPEPSVRPAEPTPAPASGTNKSKAVLAPIPGVIISITVKPGDTVSYGQELCILEAMKMKNAIRAARPGQIAAIHVTAGDHVRHGQILMEYTD